MSYEIYKRIHSEDEYFDKWDADKLETLSELNDDTSDKIYRRYTIKCRVFQRDNFKCVNENCEGKSDKLQMHHMLPQCEGGMDSVDNCVTLCHICHKNFHSGRKVIIVDGEEYKAGNFEKVRQRQHKMQMRKFRKELKYLRPDLIGKRVPWELIIMLLKFLETDYSNVWND